MILIGDKMSRVKCESKVMGANCRIGELLNYCNLCKYMEAGARGLCPKLHTFVTISDRIGLQKLCIMSIPLTSIRIDILYIMPQSKLEFCMIDLVMIVKSNTKVVN